MVPRRRPAGKAGLAASKPGPVLNSEACYQLCNRCNIVPQVATQILDRIARRVGLWMAAWTHSQLGWMVRVHPGLQQSRAGPKDTASPPRKLRALDASDSS